MSDDRDTCGVRRCHLATSLYLVIDNVRLPLCWTHWCRYCDQPVLDGRAWLRSVAADRYGLKASTPEVA